MNKRNAAPASGELPSLVAPREVRDPKAADSHSIYNKAGENHNVPHLVNSNMGGKSFKIRGQINKQTVTNNKSTVNPAISQMLQQPQLTRPETTKGKRKPSGVRAEYGTGNNRKAIASNTRARQQNNFI